MGVDTETTSLLGSANSDSRWKRRAFLACLLVVFIAVTIALYFHTRNLHAISVSAVKISLGQAITITSFVDGLQLFARLNVSSSKLVLDETFPRIHSAAFTAYETSYNCFQLKTATGKWVRLDSTGSLVADVTSQWLAGSFVAVKANTQISGSDTVKIRSCHVDQWLQISPAGETNAVATVATGKLLNGLKYFYSLISMPAKDSGANATEFAIDSQKKYRGVNLGGWFIPEYWMTPHFFNGTGTSWGASLCSITNYSRPFAEARIMEYIETWIQEDDIKQIAALGFESVRLPVGYWNIMADPYERYAPADYHISLRYIDWCFDMAEKYGLSVMLDLHGGPGSQNGQDHSGCGYSIVGQPHWTDPENVELSLQAIEIMAARYSNRSSLMGIELLNEPSQWFSEANHTVLKAYYEKAYHIIRGYSPTTLVIFNELYAHIYSWWNEALLEPAYYNVVMDIHLYDWFLSGPSETRSKHLRDARAWGPLIEQFSVYHPIIVGEWCMSTGITMPQIGAAFVDAELKSFSGALGWYMWNWKIQRNAGFDIWNVQLQAALDDGIRPVKALLMGEKAAAASAPTA